MLCEKPLQKIGFRRALLLMKPAHTGHHPGAVPGFRPSPGNSEETTTRVLTEEISVLFRVPTWDPTHPGSPVSRALPGNTPTQGPTREGKPGFFLGGGGNPGRNPGHGLGKTRERGGFRVFPGWYCWGLPRPCPPSGLPLTETAARVICNELDACHEARGQTALLYLPSGVPQMWLRYS